MFSFPHLVGQCATRRNVEQHSPRVGIRARERATSARGSSSSCLDGSRRRLSRARSWGRSRRRCREDLQLHLAPCHQCFIARWRRRAARRRRRRFRRRYISIAIINGCEMSPCETYGPIETLLPRPATAASSAKRLPTLRVV